VSGRGASMKGPAFLPVRENHPPFFTILKKREITYTYTGRVWDFGERIDLWGSVQ